VRIPPHWSVLQQRAVGPFVTALTLHRPDGSRFHWSAWHHRKGVDEADEAAADGTGWHVVAVRSLAWWISALFGIGSVLFAVGSFPATAGALGDAAGPVFVAGSVFYTIGAYLQYFEATNASQVVGDHTRGRRLVGVNAASAGWWASAIQLFGALWFNVNTVEALRSLSSRQEEALVWAPDAIGSVCFLIASYLLLMEACGRWWCIRGRSVPWRIAMINLAGSIAFGISAVAAFVVPATGAELSAVWANGATFVGALCFLIGSLIPMPLFARARARLRT
jgi:hypothetical protein